MIPTKKSQKELHDLKKRLYNLIVETPKVKDHMILTPWIDATITDPESKERESYDPTIKISIVKLRCIRCNKKYNETCKEGMLIGNRMCNECYNYVTFEKGAEF